MKLLKRITAVMAALLIVVNIKINTFAEGGPVPFNPNITVVSGGGNSPVTSILGELLIGAGLSSDLISDHKGIVDFDKEATEKFTQVYLETGQYPDTIIADDGNEYTFGEYMQYLYIKSLEEERDSWYNAMYDMGWNFYDFVHNNEGSIIPTQTTDMNGYGVKVVIGPTSSGYEIWYGNYITLYNDRGYFEPQVHGNGVIVRYILDKNTNSWVIDYTQSIDVTAYLSGEYYNYINSGFYKVTGDVRYQEDSPALPDYAVDYDFQVGELPDGTKVTVDMLDPDGTVDGQPVTPDLTKFDDEAILDLIRDMLEASKNTYETADPDTTVNPDDIAVPDVAESLENFTVPTGIITVFPFSLPFDFVRGLKTLLQKPKVPVFKAELDLTNFCGYDLGKHTIEISLEKWEPAAAVCRWFFILLYTYTLILLTGKIVKGAGA